MVTGVDAHHVHYTSILSGFIWVFTFLVRLFIGLSVFYPFKEPADLLHILCGFSFISDLTFILSILCMYLLHRLSITSDVLSLVSMFSFCLQGHLRVSCFPCVVSFLNLQFHSVVTRFVRDRVSPAQPRQASVNVKV